MPRHPSLDEIVLFGHGRGIDWTHRANRPPPPGNGARTSRQPRRRPRRADAEARGTTEHARTAYTAPAPRDRTAAGPWRQGLRAVMVLLSLHGLPAGEIAAPPDCDPSTVRRWIGRFNREGAAGLADRPRLELLYGARYSPHDNPAERIWDALKNHAANTAVTWPGRLRQIHSAAQHRGVSGLSRWRCGRAAGRCRRGHGRRGRPARCRTGRPAIGRGRRSARGRAGTCRCRCPGPGAR